MADVSGREEMSAPATSGVPPGGQAPLGTVTLLNDAACTLLILAGHVDVTMNTELSQAVDAAAQRGLRVDVHSQDVTSMDTAVIGMLAHLANILDRPLRFIAPPEIVRSLLDLTGIIDTVEVLDQQPGPSPDTGPAVRPT